MTETGPVASLRMRARQGRVVPGVRFRVVSPEGRVAPWDDRTKGELEVKGNWVAESYYNGEKSAERFDDGWLRTGDIAVVGAQGSIRIIDRAKDLVKSGGEWISSVDLELELAGHPSALEAAVIGVPNERSTDTGPESWSRAPRAWRRVSPWRPPAFASSPARIMLITAVRARAPGESCKECRRLVFRQERSS